MFGVKYLNISFLWSQAIFIRKGRKKCCLYAYFLMITTHTHTTKGPCNHSLELCVPGEGFTLYLFHAQHRSLPHFSWQDSWHPLFCIWIIDSRHLKSIKKIIYFFSQKYSEHRYFIFKLYICTYSNAAILIKNLVKKWFCKEKHRKKGISGLYNKSSQSSSLFMFAFVQNEVNCRPQYIIFWLKAKIMKRWEVMGMVSTASRNGFSSLFFLFNIEHNMYIFFPFVAV